MCLEFGEKKKFPIQFQGALNKPQTHDAGNWSRSMDHQNQDRYDRTFSERSKYMDGPTGNNTGSSRPSSFITNPRPQERYSGMSSRFDGRF